HDGRADPGAERYVQVVAGASRGAEVALADRPGMRVVDHGDRDVQPGADQVADVDLLPAEVDRGHQPGRVHRAGYRDAAGGQVQAIAVPGDLRRHVGYLPQHRVGSVGAGGPTAQLRASAAIGRHQGRFDPGGADIKGNNDITGHQAGVDRARW